MIALPPHVVELLRGRIANPDLRTDVVLFPFRKTVATRLDEAGLSARQIADHLGRASGFVLRRCAIRDSNPEPAD